MPQNSRSSKIELNNFKRRKRRKRKLLFSGSKELKRLRMT